MTEARENKIRQVLMKRQPTLTLIFENVWDPHNISAALRSADSVGVFEVFVIHTNVRPFTKLGKKSSASASKWVKANYYNSVSECINEVRKKYSKIYATHLNTNSTDLYDINFTDSIAIAFGNEHNGISDELLSACNGNISIPQTGMIQSLNISVACAVTLYEAFRQRKLAGMYEEKQIIDSVYNDLVNEWIKK